MVKGRIDFILDINTAVWLESMIKEEKRKAKRMDKQNRRWYRHAKNRDKHGTT